jgi:hypothetical protein
MCGWGRVAGLEVFEARRVGASKIPAAAAAEVLMKLRRFIIFGEGFIQDDLQLLASIHVAGLKDARLGIRFKAA